MGKKLDLENFWYYHKVKLIASIVIALVIVIVILTTHGAANPDVEIAYVTDGRTVSEDVISYMNQYFAPGIQDVNRDNKKVTAFTPLTGLKIELEFVADGSQIVLVDGGTLSKFITTGVFEPLDEYMEKYGIDSGKYPEICTKTELDENIHTYAIPLEYIPSLLELGFPSENYYLTERVIKKNDLSAQAKGKNANSIIDILLKQKVH